MNTKPVLTYSGDGPLFRSLETQITNSVPLDTCEWQRSYGRPIKNIRVEACFQPFDTKLLDKYRCADWSILEHPILHVFVTECTDVETYKSSVKDEIDSWLKVLQSYGIADWMILLVETMDVKKTKNILQRTTVLEKIRLDFASKNADRCISVLNPMKFEMKATESFRCLLQRIRHLILTGYNRNILKYEELIRANREKRNQEGWSFVKYFLLQEQLAFVLEMLGLHLEALVQYDELDAMFSQFILNSVFGDKQKWLVPFETAFHSFHGISMNRQKIFATREKIMNNTASLLEFRSYLFERQCGLLKAAERPWEIAERLIPFLFGTLREIEALHIETPEGSLACWEFVCALEVLDICEDVSEVDETSKSKCFQHCAPIWNLAKDKLYELGKLCGLLPGCTPTSSQLHTVVQLSAGIGDSVPVVVVDENETIKAPKSEQKSHSPSRKPKGTVTDRLKEALGSNASFQKLYKEQCELAISTYKHVSRLRSARLVGLDLGNFYCTLNEPHKAVVFFTDLLRELKTESWNFLVSQTYLELASCYRKMDDTLSYTKTCSAISCCLELEMLVRTFYFDEFLKSLRRLNESTFVEQEKLTEDSKIVPNTAVLEDHFRVSVLSVLNEGKIVQDNMLKVNLKLESMFPREIVCKKIALAFTMDAKSDVPVTVAIPHPTSSIAQKMPMVLHLDYKQDGTLNCASVGCENIGKNPVRRSSSTRRKITPTVRSDFTNCVTLENCSIKPGTNMLELSAKATRVGVWYFKQLSVTIDALEFLSETLPIRLESFEVITRPASAVLNFYNLVAGLDQAIKLIISAGSFIFPRDAVVSLKCSKNLRMKVGNSITEFGRELAIELQDMKPFEERTIDLEAYCELPSRRDDKHIETKVALHCPWSRNEIHIPLHFLPALTSSCRLHSSGTRKFLQVIVKGVYDGRLVLSDATMSCASPGVALQDINPRSQNEIVIYRNLQVSYLWEIQVEPLKTEIELPIINVDFAMSYADPETPDKKRPYTSHCEVADYATLFRINAKVEPSELCRVGSVCRMNLSIAKVQDNPFTDLMFEVLADQNTWVVSGRSAGVISMQDVEQQVITFEVMPLNAGFLPLPSVRISRYIAANKLKAETHPKLLPFQPGQVYNGTKSIQIHVLAATHIEC